MKQFYGYAGNFNLRAVNFLKLDSSAEFTNLKFCEMNKWSNSVAESMQLDSVMWKFLFIFCSATVFLSNYMHNFLAPISADLNKFCLSHSPILSSHREVYSALVCNSSPGATLLMSHMRTLGLFHLIVISGSHLIFLEQFVTTLCQRSGKLANALIFFLITAFTITCEFSPPIARAWISFLLRKVQIESNYFWRPPQLVLFSGLWTLLLFPNWIHSLSFTLSWAASLLITTTPSSGWVRHGVLYVGLYPILCGFQALPPASSLTNWWLGPIIGAVLFPACGAAFFIPALTPFIDSMIDLMASLSSFISRHLAPTSISSPMPSLKFIWMYILSTQMIVLLINVWLERKANLNSLYEAQRQRL